MIEKQELLNYIDDSIISALANVHTTVIARVDNVRDTTIDLLPVVNRSVNNSSIQLPKCVKVPPVFMGGGSSYTAHPIAKGDYALLVITERCYDRWYAGQDFQLPLEMRMHDLSDGFAIVGIKPSASAITIPSVITQIGDTHQEGNYTHTGNLDITGDLTVDGNITCTGRLTVTNATIGGVDFNTHRHSGVESGSDNTGTVTV